MNKPKKIRTFVISTKGILGTKRVLEHVKNNIEKSELSKADTEKICMVVERQIENKRK